MIQDIRGLKHRCQSLEAQADSLGVTNCELQMALTQREEQLQRQRHVIADLEATINAQSSDIRTALQLVSAALLHCCKDFEHCRGHTNAYSNLGNQSV